MCCQRKVLVSRDVQIVQNLVQIMHYLHPLFAAQKVTVTFRLAIPSVVDGNI